MTVTGSVVAFGTVPAQPDGAEWVYARARASWLDSAGKQRTTDGERTQAKVGLRGRVGVVLPDDAQVTGVQIVTWPLTADKATAVPINGTEWGPAVTATPVRVPTAAGRALVNGSRASEFTEVSDVLADRRLQELAACVNWAFKHGVNIAITEAGWPMSGNASDVAWQQLADAYLQDCDAYGVPVFRWSDGYGAPLAGYEGRGKGPLDTAKPGIATWEKHLPTGNHGVSMFSMCQAGRDPRTKQWYDVDHRDVTTVKAEHPDTFTYLKARGHTFVRLPYRPDRVGTTALDGPLDPERWGLYRRNVDNAIAAGLLVLIDPHCGWGWRFAGQDKDTTSRVNGDGNLTPADYIAHLKLVAADLDAAGYHGRYAIELTNEPHGEQMSTWTDEQISQQVVDAFRADGNDTHLLIPSFPFDAALDLPRRLPWIVDPYGPGFHSYVVHHYWDSDRSGKTYPWPTYQRLVERILGKAVQPVADPPVIDDTTD